MIGHIQGEVLFSDGHELIILTNSGIGYQVFYGQILAEGSHASIYISHVIKEASEELYGFHTLRAKKLFEMLTSVKGVGPKSAFNLIMALGEQQIITSISLEDKKALTKAPGIGPKAAAQMILDLGSKIHKIKMYGDSYKIMIPAVVADGAHGKTKIVQETLFENKKKRELGHDENQIIIDTIMACKELGFREDQIIPVAQKVLKETQVSRPEQLVHLVLKEI